jgi:GNAT superfamily N-acetyltransferase
VATVRGYEPRDLEECRGLWVELTQWHRDIFEAPEIGGEDPGRAFDEHLAKVGAENIWLAEVDGRVVGLAGLIPDGPELEPVVVSKQHRGRGVGRLLAEAAISAARDRGARTVQVRPVARNVEAVRFFHELGFDVLDQLQLSMDIVDRERDPWIPGERLADRDFRF